MSLPCNPEERNPFLRCHGILGQRHIARELEDSLGRIDGAVRLLVVEYIPDARGAVLGIARPRGIREALLARCMGAEQRDERMGTDRLGPEESDEVDRVGKGAG